MRRAPVAAPQHCKGHIARSFCELRRLSDQGRVHGASHLQVTYATDLAAQGLTDAAAVAQSAARVPLDAVSKPVQHMRSYFGNSSDTASVKSDDDGHALRPLLSTFQEVQAANGGSREASSAASAPAAPGRR